MNVFADIYNRVLEIKRCNEFEMIDERVSSLTSCIFVALLTIT